MPLPANFTTKVNYGNGQCRNCGIAVDNNLKVFCDNCKKDRKRQYGIDVINYLNSYILRHS